MDVCAFRKALPMTDILDRNAADRRATDLMIASLATSGTINGGPQAV